MGFTESSRYCANCKRQVLVRQETPNHTVLVLITLLSCGLWGIVWLALTLMALGNPWRCTVCGSPTNAAFTATLPTGFRPLQPVNNQSINFKVLIGIVVILGGLALLGMFIPDTRSRKESRDTYSPSQITYQTPLPSPSVMSSPTRSKVSPTADNGFNTERSRDILARFFIKPVLRSMLNNPDSLQDLEVISVIPSKKMPDVYIATVSYRAENSFGALVYQHQSFMITKGTGTGLDAWRVTPLKD